MMKKKHLSAALVPESAFVWFPIVPWHLFLAVSSPALLLSWMAACGCGWPTSQGPRHPAEEPKASLVTAPCMALEGPAEGDILGELSGPSSGQRPRWHLEGSRAWRDLPWMRPEGAFGDSLWGHRFAGESYPPR